MISQQQGYIQFSDIYKQDFMFCFRFDSNYILLL